MREFDLSVAFITASGIQVLAGILSQLRQRGIKGRILTSTYLCFNDPDALRKLLEYPNIETRVYQGDLHAKGYFFNKRGISTIIIGSSNLTQTALTCNKEWNVLFRSFPTGDIAHKTKPNSKSSGLTKTPRRTLQYRKGLPGPCRLPWRRIKRLLGYHQPPRARRFALKSNEFRSSRVGALYCSYLLVIIGCGKGCRT